MDLTSDRDDTVEHDPAGGSRVEAGVVEHPSADDFADARELPADATWFKHAVFYEVLVRAFYDSNADGFGDLRGLTERIDYLQWLGVDCIWLPPFYDSVLWNLSGKRGGTGYLLPSDIFSSPETGQSPKGGFPFTPRLPLP